MKQQFASLAILGTVAAACADPVTPTTPARLAPVIEIAADVRSELVPNEYIVVLRSPPTGGRNLAPRAQALATPAGATLTYVYGDVISGFAVRADPAALNTLRAALEVSYLEPVITLSAIATQSPTPSWGLDRVDQVSLPLDNAFTYPTGGGPVHVYIIDTGIRLTHVDFTGRIGNGYDAVTTGGDANDCNGHGTHVAGTAGGTTYGIMKSATLHPVRVLNCQGSGTTSGVVAGINWVAANKIDPAVANLSLGGSPSSTLDNAVNSLVNGGTVTAVAAGNSNADACNASPARAANALTVGSTTSSDARSSFSNFGTCLDLFAPGSSITSDYANSNTSTAVLSGTSMASPHVAGVAALYRSLNPTRTATQVADAIISNASLNKVSSPGTGSPNRLLYMGFLNGAPPPPPPPPPSNQPPVADFTYACTAKRNGDFRCTFDGSASSDPDGSVVSWLWTSPGKSDRTGVSITWTFGPGTHTVNLTVTDNQGATNTKSQNVALP